MLIAALASQQKMNALARERSLAMNGIRAYIEAMRQAYPSKDTVNMVGFFTDITTPVDYLPTLGVEASALPDARGLVLKLGDETGYSWGPASGLNVSSSTALTRGGVAVAAPCNWVTNVNQAWLWTDATMTTVASVNTGTFNTGLTVPWTYTSHNTAATVPSFNDLDGLGYVMLGATTSTNGGVVGRDLDASGTISNTDTTSHAAVYAANQVFVPVQITISWKSGSGGEKSSSALTSRQRITLYASFGPYYH
jgi:hypothetical protein